MLPKDTFKGRYSTYQLQDVIGRGGNAVVYSALDTVTQKMVAIKRMIAADESMLHRWRIEVEALISLREQGTNSQFVVAYLDHMQVGKAIMLVEEYAPNGSLLGLLRRGEHKGAGLSESRVVACMYQVTRGLEYIHSKRIVHRDLKCANVLLFDEGRLLKLSDFGLAAGGPPPTALSAADAEVEGGGGAGKGEEEEGVLGSVYWMAPEIACGKPHSTSSDVWSLGCLCVELLTGRPPFFDREPVNALYCIAEGSVSPMPKRLSLSDDCRSFLQECFHTDPSLRPSAARLVQHRWFSELRIDSRLAELAATNHSATTREGSALAESGRSATSMGLLSASGSTREQWSPTASFTRAHTGASSPPAAKGSGRASRRGRASGDVRALFDEDKATEDRLGQFVEHALFFKPAAECEQWLKDQGLKRVVDSLDTAIPLDAYDVLNLIAHAAKSSESKHELVLTALGETDLWGSQKLLQPTTRSDLAIIFSGCCKRQSPDVPFYTPCDCHALQFLLNTDGSDAESSRVVEPAHCAIRALHTLFVAPLSSQGQGTGEAAAGADNALTRAAHRSQAMRLFVAGGGFEEVRRVVERQCERSLRTTTDPSLGWPAIAMLIEVLTAVESGLASLCTGPTVAAAAAGASLPSWTPPTSITSVPAAGNSTTRDGAQDTVRLAAAACRLLVGPHIASKRYDALSSSFSEAVPVLENTTTSAGLAASLRTPNASMVAPVPPSPMPSSTAAGAARTGSGEAMRQPSTPHTAGILPSSATDESGGPGARSVVAEPSPSQMAVEEVPDNSTLGGASPTVRWFLGLQHASRSHHCLPAVLLLLRYAGDSAATHAPYLDDVGRWLGRSVLLIASYNEEDPIVRLRALSVLAALAQASPVTQAALRDVDVAVPVLTYVTLHPPPIDGAQRAVLECVSGLCRFDARFAALTLAPGSPMVATLITVLHTASELAGLGPGEPTLTNGEAEARVARLEEEATACGRRPQEEMSMCLALLSQAAVLAKNANGAAANSGGAGAPNVSGVSGGGDSHGGGGPARMAEPTLVKALVMDLNAMEDKLPQDNSAAEALRASARSLQAELGTATPQHS